MLCFWVADFNLSQILLQLLFKCFHNRLVIYLIPRTVRYRFKNHIFTLVGVTEQFEQFVGVIFLNLFIWTYFHVLLIFNNLRFRRILLWYFIIEGNQWRQQHLFLITRFFITFVFFLDDLQRLDTLNVFVELHDIYFW